MHPRNRYYGNPADFNKLGEIYPEFGQYLLPTSHGCTINFKDPKALRELTISLLHHDFGLNIELPLDRLIPTITLRLNYIHWIEDLLQMLPSDVNQTTAVTTGIDIGTGASCIYPLLGAKINGWKFCASEVDDLSYRFACENVKRNDLEENIQVCLVTRDVIMADLLAEGERYDFTMCNPPFFAERSEMVGNRSGHRPQPSSVCTGTESEILTSGGEVTFVGKMIDDSLKLGSRIKWYTTMLGKKSSLTCVVARLKEHGISSIVTTEFCQGRTTRWGVAWTFLSQVITKCTPPKKKRKNKLLQFSLSTDKVCPCESLSETTDVSLLISRISERFKELLDDLQIEVVSETIATTADPKTIKLHCNATSHTWGDQRRKRREAAGKLGTRKQPSTNHNSGATEGTAVSVTPQIENLHCKTTSLVGIDINCTTGTAINNVVTTTGRTQNNETRTSDASTENKMISPHTDDRKRKEAISFDSASPKHKILKRDDNSENEQFFLAFVVTLEAKYDDVTMLPQMLLRMEWINGSDRNCMYQLFQYFQNLFSC